MADEPTCGKGLEEHSSLSTKMGEVIGVVAENLELHIGTLDLTDERSRIERDGYDQLVRQHRDLAASLKSTAAQMAGYRDLPMGRHDENALMDPKRLNAFETLVQQEEQLLALLQLRLNQHQQMLAEARKAVDGPE